MHVIAGTSWASYVSDSIALKDNIGILILMLGIALLSAVIAGIAPALYSTAQPAALVLKGSYAMSVKGKMLRNVLVSLQVQIVSLPAAYVVGCLTIEFEVGLELAVAHFGIYLANDCAV